MKLYLSGPMRGFPSLNAELFDEVAEALRAEGYEVVSPIEHDREVGIDLDNFDLDESVVQDLMAWDVQQVLETDAVVRLPGWHSSEGARLEVLVADATGRGIYDWPDRLPHHAHVGLVHA